MKINLSFAPKEFELDIPEGMELKVSKNQIYAYLTPVLPLYTKSCPVCMVSTTTWSPPRYQISFMEMVHSFQDEVVRKETRKETARTLEELQAILQDWIYACTL